MWNAIWKANSPWTDWVGMWALETKYIRQPLKLWTTESKSWYCSHHYFGLPTFQNFSERLSDMPVNVDYSIVFEVPNNGKYMLRVCKGTLDIVIGNTSIVNSSKFKDLGIIDY